MSRIKGLVRPDNLAGFEIDGKPNLRDARASPALIQAIFVSLGLLSGREVPNYRFPVTSGLRKGEKPNINGRCSVLVAHEIEYSFREG